jgi:predicted ATPase
LTVSKEEAILELLDTEGRVIFMGIRDVDSRYFNYFNSSRTGPKAKSFDDFNGIFISKAIS